MLAALRYAGKDVAMCVVCGRQPESLYFEAALFDDTWRFVAHCHGEVDFVVISQGDLKRSDQRAFFGEVCDKLSALFTGQSTPDGRELARYNRGAV